jgi:primosomal protein N'
MQAGTVLGPAQLLRLNGRERAQVVVLTSHAHAIAASMRSFIRSTTRDRKRDDVRVVVDVDPQSLV